MGLLLRRERLIVCGCLVAIVVLSWLYLLHLKAAMDMSGVNMPGMVMLDTQEWGATTVLLLFVMWAVMMVAMMVPSATPTDTHLWVLPAASRHALASLSRRWNWRRADATLANADS